jgi:hypothetical protein
VSETFGSELRLRVVVADDQAIVREAWSRYAA